MKLTTYLFLALVIVNKSNALDVLSNDRFTMFTELLAKSGTSCSFEFNEKLDFQSMKFVVVRTAAKPMLTFQMETPALIPGISDLHAGLFIDPTKIERQQNGDQLIIGYEIDKLSQFKMSLSDSCFDLSAQSDRKVLNPQIKICTANGGRKTSLHPLLGGGRIEESASLRIVLTRVSKHSSHYQVDHIEGARWETNDPKTFQVFVCH